MLVMLLCDFLPPCQKGRSKFMEKGTKKYEKFWEKFPCDPIALTDLNFMPIPLKYRKLFRNSMSPKRGCMSAWAQFQNNKFLNLKPFSIMRH